MPYLIDTDIYIYLTKGAQSIKNKIEEVGEDQIYVSAITVAELYYGIFKSKQQSSNLKKIQQNIERLQILNFNKHTASIFGRLKAELNQKGTPIDDMDLAIAAIALDRNCVLVTHNTKHFYNIKELLLEDWS